MVFTIGTVYEAISNYSDLRTLYTVDRISKTGKTIWIKEESTGDILKRRIENGAEGQSCDVNDSKSLYAKNYKYSMESALEEKQEKHNNYSVRNEKY